LDKPFKSVSARLSDELNKEFMQVYMIYSRERTANDLWQPISETKEIAVKLANIVEKLNQITDRTSQAVHTSELHDESDEQEVSTLVDIHVVDPPDVVKELEAINTRLRQSINVLDQIVGVKE
jgi:hypothetical protein